MISIRDGRLSSKPCGSDPIASLYRIHRCIGETESNIEIILTRKKFWSKCQAKAGIRGFHQQPLCGYPCFERDLLHDRFGKLKSTRSSFSTALSLNSVAQANLCVPSPIVIRNLPGLLLPRLFDCERFPSKISERDWGSTTQEEYKYVWSVNNILAICSPPNEDVHSKSGHSGAVQTRLAE